MIKFDAPKEMSSIIKVLGVGGGGSNAVNHMYNQGIRGVDFIICNTDSQALDTSPIPHKIQLGASLTEGRGAGSIPEVGKNCALENIEEIKEVLSKNTKMLFITAGMGGGTGTGAAPVIAAISKEMGILTVGIVTIPFSFEGRKRKMQAEKGIEELRQNVDTLLIISNDKLRELYGNLKLFEAFGRADNILTNAARGIAEIITVTGYVNVDFEDVKTVMKDSGVAIMGTGIAGGENRALEAVEMALSSPLLNDNQIVEASNILLYISTGNDEIEMDEVAEITDYIQEEAGMSAEIIWGIGRDESLEDKINITVIATGFKTELNNSLYETSAPKKNILKLEEEKPAPAKATTNHLEEDDGMVLITRKPENTVAKEQRSEKVEEILRFSPTSISSPEENKEKIIIHTLDEEVGTEPEPIFRPVVESKVENKVDPTIEERQKSSYEDRLKKLRNLSTNLTNPESFSEIEKVPAYMRRGVNLSNTPASDEQIVSRYTLDAETGEIKSNNSFLHDNVD
ncbi:MAG: cell division protein FtsZ [Bacteroidales bacterium]|nr:cell division protein FtsZ [Bacteroidales bacterium]